MWVEVMLDICVVADKRASAGCTFPPQNRGGLLRFPGNEASRVHTCCSYETRTSVSTATVQPVTGIDGEKEKLKAARLSP